MKKVIAIAIIVIFLLACFSTVGMGLEADASEKTNDNDKDADDKDADASPKPPSSLKRTFFYCQVNTSGFGNGYDYGPVIVLDYDTDPSSTEKNAKTKIKPLFGEEVTIEGNHQVTVVLPSDIEVKKLGYFRYLELICSAVVVIVTYG